MFDIDEPDNNQIELKDEDTVVNQEASIEALMSNFMAKTFKPPTPEPTTESEEEEPKSALTLFMESVLDSLGLLPPDDI